MPQLRLVLATVFGLLCLRPLIVAANEPAVIPALKLTEGKLPNGLRYQVLPHTAPRGGISLRLVVKAGSIDEHDDERGFAHFVEHMAFNGTKHHPAGTLMELFQRLGLTAGADLNANTGYTVTTYKLDLPEDRADHLGETLKLLRDYADGILFSVEEVKREKPVIMSELRARDTPAARVGREMNHVLVAGSLLDERDPIGLPKQIEGATSESLRKFYQRCYQPGRMTVIVVGQIEPAKVVEQISTEFGSMQADSNAPAPVEVTLPAPSGSSAHIVLNPNSGSAASFSIVTVVPRPPSTPAGLRQELTQILASSVLSRRIQERREKYVTKFGTCRATDSLTINGHFIIHTIEVQTAMTRFKEAVNFAETELRRARLQGFEDAELKESVTTIITQFRNAAHAVPSMSCQQVAADLMDDVVSGSSPWRSPAELLAIAEKECPTITTDDLGTALDTLYPEESLHLVLRLEKPMPDGEKAVLDAYHESEKEVLPKTRSAKGELAFLYENFGPSGKIRSDITETDLGLRMATFANGVRLNLRPSTLEPERFRLQAVIGHGILDVPKNRPSFAQIAGIMCNINDLGRHSRTEVSRLMKLHGVTGRIAVVDNSCIATFSGPSEELPFALRLLTASLSDQKFESERQSVVYSSYNATLRSLVSTPASLAQLGGRYKLGAGDPRLFFPPLDVVRKYRFGDLTDWIHDRWLEGPLEIGIVGDFKNDDVLVTAAASVGTLSARKTGKNSEPLKFTDTSGKQVSRPKLKAGAATAYLAWPATLPDDPASNRALRLAADVLMDRLRLKLREELGATYSPHVSLFRDRQQRDYGYIWAALTFEPARASAMTDRVIALADELVSTGVTPEELERLREPRRSANARQMRDNAWWLDSVVSCAQSRPDVMEEARGHLTGYDTITAADVNRAAQALREDAVTAVVIVPAPETADATPATPPEP